MATNSTGGVVDTLEFLKLTRASSVGREQPAPGQASYDQPPATSYQPASGGGAASAGAAGQAQPVAARGVPSPADSPYAQTSAAPQYAQYAQGQQYAQGAQGQRGGSQPVVIKGGPRRVVRADGVIPKMSFALGQKRFSLSSGHALFAPRREFSKVAAAIIFFVCLALIGAGVFVAWHYANQTAAAQRMQEVVGTTDYDGNLSLTPANDGGYYTVFMITGTATDQDQIGDLSQISMVRSKSNKSISSAARIEVPWNLYVAPSGSYKMGRTIAQVLQDQGISKALGSIGNIFGIRLYNVVLCDQRTFNELLAIMDGRVDDASYDAQGLLGRVRTNLSLENLVAYCGKVADNGGYSRLQVVTVPTSDLTVSGMTMARGNSESYKTVLANALSPVTPKLDYRGCPVGTQYDIWGNPILDERQMPVGTLYDTEGNPVYDQDGYLQFYGQQLDERGCPVGTQYDQWGNPLLDDRMNPLGTQYDDAGVPLVDWRGNIVIYKS